MRTTLAALSWQPALPGAGTRSAARIWLGRTAQLVAGQSVVQGLALLTGLLLVRWMDKQAYAQYTLAASALAILNVVTDLGLSSAVLAIGGRYHTDGASLTGLVKTALRYRRGFLYGSVPVLLLVMPWVFSTHGWPSSTAWLITIAVLLSSWFQAGAVIYGAVLRLHFAIGHVQTVDAIAGTIRIASVILLGAGQLSAVVALAINLLGSVWQFTGNRLSAARYLTDGVPCGPRHLKAVWGFTHPLIAANLFYAAQGQITIWLVSFLAPVAAIAEVGALGRLGQVALLLSTPVTFLVQPYLARLPSKTLYRIRVLQIGFVEAMGAVLLAFSGFALPKLWLFLLGARYAGLGTEVMLAIVLASFVFLGDCFYFALIARCQTRHQWLRIPMTLVGVVAGCILSPPVNVMAAVVFQFYAITPYVLLQGFLLTQYLFNP
jgi:O-antigen/teichoic acid export membrane protein